MESALVVSGTEKGISALSQLLGGGPFRFRFSTAASGSQTRRLLLQEEFDLIVINAPLPDETGEELAVFAAGSTLAGVLLLVKGESAETVSARVEQAGVLVAPKPVSRPLFYQACRLVAASRRRILGLQNENVKLQQKIEEIRLVDRAKCVLIQYLNMSEQQAHRYIEKQAMDRRLPKAEVAENILKTYET